MSLLLSSFHPSISSNLSNLSPQWGNEAKVGSVSYILNHLHQYYMTEERERVKSCHPSLLFSINQCPPFPLFLLISIRSFIIRDSLSLSSIDSCYFCVWFDLRCLSLFHAPPSVPSCRSPLNSSTDLPYNLQMNIVDSSYLLIPDQIHLTIKQSILYLRWNIVDSPSTKVTSTSYFHLMPLGTNFPLRLYSLPWMEVVVLVVCHSHPFSLLLSSFNFHPSDADMEDWNSLIVPLGGSVLVCAFCYFLGRNEYSVSISLLFFSLLSLHGNIPIESRLVWCSFLYLLSSIGMVVVTHHLPFSPLLPF